MRALLAFPGSRGDAQPGILLARALIARGHEVTLALAPNLIGLATGHGVSAVAFGCDSAALLRAQRADARFRSRDPRVRLRALLDLQRRGVPEALADLRRLAPGHDVVVAGMAGEEPAAVVAREAGLPSAAIHFFPIQPNTVVPVVPARWAARMPGSVHRAGWALLARARAASLAPILPAGQQTARLRIQAYDPALFPGLSAEVPGPFTGFPLDVDGFGAAATDSAANDDAGGRALRQWLAAGAAPIYVGFGSMDVGDPAEFVTMVRAVCARRGRRLLLAAGWAAIAPGITRDLAVAAQVDHAEVLPRCVAVVHHGGAGTTAAALRAGVPQVICSVQADQPYWGQALSRLGVAATLPAGALTEARLHALLDTVSAAEVRRRAATQAARLRTDGVARAAVAVESLVPVGADRIGADGRLS
ncbi:glycosyltransferase [Nocardia rhizosphaerae]|uniref:Glycosyltransferase n=1 Tax=Nocardia rhizosphaerae TaxID=1691571 RepID=A0ABV8LCR6_9NOCA